MNEKVKGQRITITDPQHLIDLGMTLGLNLALQALEEIPMAEKLTGCGISRYAIRAVEAEQRVRVMQKNIRLAIQHGIDIDANNIVFVGKAEIIIEPMDLVELAEASPRPQPPAPKPLTL